MRKAVERLGLEVATCAGRPGEVVAALPVTAVPEAVSGVPLSTVGCLGLSNQETPQSAAKVAWASQKPQQRKRVSHVGAPWAAVGLCVPCHFHPNKVQRAPVPVPTESGTHNAMGQVDDTHCGTGQMFHTVRTDIRRMTGSTLSSEDSRNATLTCLFVVHAHITQKFEHTISHSIVTTKLPNTTQHRARTVQEAHLQQHGDA